MFPGNRSSLESSQDDWQGGLSLDFSGYRLPAVASESPHRRTESEIEKMGSFWRENWIWIVAPLVLILVAVTVLVLSSRGDGEDAAFIYNIF